MVSQDGKPEEIIEVYRDMSDYVLRTSGRKDHITIPPRLANPAFHRLLSQVPDQGPAGPDPVL